MDYERIIHSLVDPIVEEPESVLIRISEGSTSKDVVIIIASEKDDTARLIGKKGSIATALREMMSIVGKTDNKRIHLKFESFDEEGKVED